MKPNYLAEELTVRFFCRIYFEEVTNVLAMRMSVEAMELADG
jgi:hypothetical protein